MRQLLKYSALITVVALLAACDKVPLLAPSGSVITLSANALTVPANGTVGLTAFVTESSGTPVQNGTTVRFTSTLGTVSPSEVQTANGLAVATFQAGASSGVAEVRAISGGATGTSTGTGTAATTTNMVQITIGAAAVTSVAVRANPGTVPAAGGTVEIIATALGGATSANLPIPNVSVTFSATAGTLSATSALTDANGEGRVLLTTSRKSTVTASVGAQTKTVDVTPIAPPSLTLGAITPATPTVGQTIIFSITPAADTAPSVTVAWGDGSNTSLGVIRGAQSVSHAYRNVGSYGITVTATEDGSTFSTSTAVTVGPPPSVTLSVSPNNGGTTATNFVFTVTPATANGVKNVTLDFGDGTSRDLGAITAPATVTHRYSAADTYTAQATETDGNGNTTNAIVVIIVN